MIADPVESINRHSFASPITHYLIDLDSQSYKTFTIESDGHRKETQAASLPDGEAVGLWGFNMGDGDLALGLVCACRK